MWSFQKMLESKSLCGTSLKAISAAYFMSYAAILFLVFITFAAIAVAIYETYYPVETATTFSLEIIFFAIFFIDLIMDVIRANYLIDYLLSWPFFYDITACISILTLAFPDSPWLIFFRFFRVFKLLEVLRLRRSWAVEAGIQRGAMNREAVTAFETSSISYSVARLVVNILAFFIISTAAVYSISTQLPNSFINSTSEEDALSFGNALYFCIVTITTVGYGEILPVSTEAKILTIVMIIVGFTVIPHQISLLITTIGHAKDFRGELHLHRHKKHILITGIVDYELLYHACSDLFQFGSSDEQIYNIRDEIGPRQRVVLTVLSSEEPDDRVQMLLVKYQGLVNYMLGNAKNFTDLQRVKADQAHAIIILPDCVAYTLREEEDSIFLSTLAVTKFFDVCGRHCICLACRKRRGDIDAGYFSASHCCKPSPNVECKRGRIIVKLTGSGRNQPILKAMGIDVVIKHTEMKYSLLALGTCLPGFLACFQALVGWTEAESGSNGRYGRCWNVHQVKTHTLHPGYADLPFSQALPSAYAKSRGLVILVALKYCGRVIINPIHIDFATLGEGVTLRECESMFVLAPSYEAATECLSTIPPHTQNSSPSLGSQDSSHSQPSEDLLASVLRKKADSGRDLDRTSQQSQEEGGGGSTKSVLKINPFLHIAPTTPSRESQIQAPSLYASALDPLRDKSLYIELTSEMRDHHVILLMTNPSDSLTAELTPSQIMLPLIYFMRVLRNYSNADVLVLSERAGELMTLVNDVEQVQPHLLHNVYFITGHPRRPAELYQCGVKNARTVSIVRSSCVSSMQIQDFTHKSSIAKDKNCIIASLNLHLLLSGLMYNEEGSKSGSVTPGIGSSDSYGGDGGNDEEGGSMANVVSTPFVAVDIAHESNSLFLRHISTAPRCAKSKEASKDDADTVDATDNDENEDVDGDVESNREADVALMQSGGILMEMCLDNLLVQSVYYADISAFWERVFWGPFTMQLDLGMDEAYDSNIGIASSSPGNPHCLKSNRTVTKAPPEESPGASKKTDHEEEMEPLPSPEPQSALEMGLGPMRGLNLELPVEERQTKVMCISEEEKEEEANHSISSAAALGTTDTELNDNFPVPSREDGTRSLSAIDSSRRLSGSSASSEHVGANMHVSRIPVPVHLQNKTFYEAVLYLFKTARLIAFAIFREPGPGRKNCLPVTLTCPDPSTRIKSSDQIFVFTK